MEKVFRFTKCPILLSGAGVPCDSQCETGSHVTGSHETGSHETGSHETGSHGLSIILLRYMYIVRVQVNEGVFVLTF